MTPLVCAVLEWDKGPFLCIPLFSTSKQSSGSQRPLLKAAASLTDSLNSSLGPRAAQRAGFSPHGLAFLPREASVPFQRTRFSGYQPFAPRAPTQMAMGCFVQGASYLSGCPSLSPCKAAVLTKHFLTLCLPDALDGNSHAGWE